MYDKPLIYILPLLTILSFGGCDVVKKILYPEKTAQIITARSQIILIKRAPVITDSFNISRKVFSRFSPAWNTDSGRAAGRFVSQDNSETVASFRLTLTARAGSDACRSDAQGFGLSSFTRPVEGSSGCAFCMSSQR